MAGPADDASSNAATSLLPSLPLWAAAASAAPLAPPGLAADAHPAAAVPVARCAGSNPVGVDHLTLCPSG